MSGADYREAFFLKMYALNAKMQIELADLAKQMADSNASIKKSKALAKAMKAMKAMKGKPMKAKKSMKGMPMKAMKSMKTMKAMKAR